MGLGSSTIISPLLFKEKVLRGICLPDHATQSREAPDNFTVKEGPRDNRGAVATFRGDNN